MLIELQKEHQQRVKAEAEAAACAAEHTEPTHKPQLYNGFTLYMAGQMARRAAWTLSLWSVKALSPLKART